MPQMAPLSWLNLFILFVATFLILNSLNYFSFMYQNNQSKMAPKMKSINWKW
uniref:ATP synthase F0 subunit 8 n=1 Tax=Agriotes hirayamai TaxID=1610005 RepID=UPI0022F2C49E|nr:ATP synthase F0 subunit 8 [Agriotes hirayamai]QEH58436.1 ATP synthase F0 subunit 8 [Agriotes hirayamai]